MKVVIAASTLLALLIIGGAGYLLIRGASAVAGTLLTWAAPAVEAALPPELAPAGMRERLDRVIALTTEGRIDASALNDTVLLLPGALLDGKLEPQEVEALSQALDRAIAPPKPAES